MALAYVRSVSRIQQLEDVAFFARYGEVSRIVDYFAEPADAVAERILDLHRRHAAAACRVFDEAISAHASAFREGSLAADCLLCLVVGQHGTADAYPHRSEESGAISAIDTKIRITVDEAGKRVVFDRWGEIKGVSAQLLMTLAEPFRGATHDERAPENYPFINSRDLQRQTKCHNEETFRRACPALSEKIEKLALNVGDAPLSTSAVIENNPWHGYRLNPDRVRIVALSDLPRAIRSRFSAKRSRFCALALEIKGVKAHFGHAFPHGRPQINRSRRSKFFREIKRRAVLTSASRREKTGPCSISTKRTSETLADLTANPRTVAMAGPWSPVLEVGRSRSLSVGRR